MRKNLLLFILSSLFYPGVLFSQPTNYDGYGLIIKYKSNFTPFPHRSRAEGYNYKGEHYSAEEHYSDSTVLIFVPDYINDLDSMDFVFYFHGWRNNIDTTLSRFNLIEQFHNSGKKGILIIPESAKNSPDSFGGKLEEKGLFNKLVSEILIKLQSKLGKELILKNISLAGHSGAYRVISFILLHGGLTDKIEAVFLFDGLYGDIEKYSYWIDNSSGKFINIYTPEGGTVAESENLMLCLSGWNIPFEFIESDDFSSNDLMNSRIVFIRSRLDHSAVIYAKNQFQKFLESNL